MRLIGGRDYYDNALQFGRDEDVVFVRSDPQEIPEDKMGIPVARGEHRIKLNNPKGWGFYPDDSTYVISFIVAIVAGKRYNLIRFNDKRSKNILEHRIHLFFTFDEFENHIQEKWDCHTYKSYRNDRNLTKDFFEQEITPTQYQTLINKRIVTALFDECTEYYAPHRSFRDTNKNWIINSDNLKNVSLYRVLDSFSCFQEISMWVGGIMPKNPNPMVVITDDTIKAEKHGFNKFSFRKGKQTR